MKIQWPVVFLTLLCIVLVGLVHFTFHFNYYTNEPPQVGELWCAVKRDNPYRQYCWRVTDVSDDYTYLVPYKEGLGTKHSTTIKNLMSTTVKMTEDEVLQMKLYSGKILP